MRNPGKVVLKIIDVKKEDHNAAQPQIDRLCGVVITLKITLHLKYTHQIEDASGDSDQSAKWTRLSMVDRCEDSVYEAPDKQDGGSKNCEEQTFAV
jgi:hypothetical protein